MLQKLIVRSRKVTATASARLTGTPPGATGKASSTAVTAPSTTPSPPGVNGITVSNDEAKATKIITGSVRCRPSAPSASITKNSRKLSSSQTTPVSSANCGKIRGRNERSAADSNGSYLLSSRWGIKRRSSGLNQRIPASPATISSTSTSPATKITLVSLGKCVPNTNQPDSTRKLNRPSISSKRSAKIVPNVAENETRPLRLSRYPRYASPSFAGTIQFANHDKYRYSISAGSDAQL